MEQRKVNLGEAYSFLVLGMGHKGAHHSMQGEYVPYHTASI